jgi:calcium/calmodulin-dependent protein kinase I
MGKTLGQGSFATVKLATKKTDGSKWAVKIIKKGSLSAEDSKMLQTEVEVLESVKHTNIVSLLETFDTSAHLYMVMEVCAGGELFDRIVEKDHYSEMEAITAIKQVATALAYCHEKNIVHRDLKPENLLYSDHTDQATLKLADFGLAKLLDAETMLHTQCGTPGYVAPEIVKNDPYGTQVDMWSLGVISYILLCGFPPFYDDNNQKLFKAIKSGKYEYPSPFWDDVTDLAKDLIDKLLVLDPNDRYTAKQVLEHPFITGSSPSTRKLEHFNKCMVSYNARRKFRAGIMSLQAISAMKGFGAAKPANVQKAMIGALASSVKAVKEEDSAAVSAEGGTEGGAAEAPAPAPAPAEEVAAAAPPAEEAATPELVVTGEPAAAADAPAPAA